MSVEKMPARIAAAGGCGLIVQQLRAGLLTIETCQYYITGKQRELAVLTPGTEEYIAKQRAIVAVQRLQYGLENQTSGMS